MMGKTWSVFLLHLLIILTAAEWCNFDFDDDYETYCSNGCCGKNCCFVVDEFSPVPLIVGCSIGGFFFIITIISVLYACLRSGTRPGRVISIGGSTSINTVTISSTGTSISGYAEAPTVPQLPPYSLPPPPPYTPYPEPMEIRSPQISAVNYNTVDPPPVYSLTPPNQGCT